MKTIGLIGGMSWESTTTYYQMINRGIKMALGKNHSAKIIMISVDFQEIATLQHDNKWDELSILMTNASKKLEVAGADCVVLCTNTMHLLATDIQNAIKIPFLHIADAIAKETVRLKLSKVALLGTKFTMEKDFLKSRLENNNVEVIIPDEFERQSVHDIIYNELTKGILDDNSRNRYLEILESLQTRGAEAIILGCTEIGLLVSDKNTDCVLIDSTAVHAQAAIDFALS
ncbi:MAG: hypothetical protein RLZZ312_1505 [Bacteroidota bacterium]|jgi:aspartate racemase